MESPGGLFKTNKAARGGSLSNKRVFQEVKK